MTHNQVAYFQARIQEAANLEQARHNKRQEALTGEQVAATREYNTLQAVNTARSIAETERHNKVNEYLESGRIEAQRLYNEAQIKIANAQLLISERTLQNKEDTLTETSTHNRNMEGETTRSNMVREAETQKQNTWTNLLHGAQILTGLSSAVGVALIKRSVDKAAQSAPKNSSVVPILNLVKYE